MQKDMGPKAQILARQGSTIYLAKPLGKGPSGQKRFVD
jgi:hypothetical protein